MVSLFGAAGLAPHPLSVVPFVVLLLAVALLPLLITHWWHTNRNKALVSAALACGEEAEPVRRELARVRQGTVTALRGRFEWAAAEGDLPTGADCETLALYATAVLDGLAVLAASGATAADLRRVADLTMRMWPS